MCKFDKYKIACINIFKRTTCTTGALYKPPIAKVSAPVLNRKKTNTQNFPCATL